MAEKEERKTWQLFVLGALAVASFVLCVAGFLAIDGTGDWRNWTNALYHSLRIWGFEYDGPRAPQEVPAALHIGRLGALATVLLGTWFAAVALLRERLTPARLYCRGPQVLFCGITPESLRIAFAQVAAFPARRLALLARSADAPLAQRFRREISKLVLTGEPAARHSLKAARIGPNTELVYAAGETDAETLRIVRVLLSELEGRALRASPLRIVSLLRDGSLLQALPDPLHGIDPRQVELSWLDTTAIAARVLLQRLPPDAQPRQRRIHVLLWGSTPLMEALVLQLARNVYPREGLTRITVVAPDAGHFRSRLLSRHPALAADFADRQLFGDLHPLVELDWLDRTPATLSAEDLSALEQASPLTCAYVDGGHDSDTLLMSQRLLQLRMRAQAGFPVGAHFHQPRAIEDLVVVSSNGDVFRYEAGEQYLGQRLDLLAVLSNYAYQRTNPVPAPDATPAEQERAWITAHEQWRQAHEWQRQSSRAVADHIAVKLRYLGLEAFFAREQLDVAEAAALRDRLLEHLPQLGRLEHRRFCAERMLAGWLPAPSSLWTPAGSNEAVRDRLKELRLNATLAFHVEQTEMEKDERLAASLAWMLWLVAHQPDAVRAGRRSA